MKKTEDFLKIFFDDLSEDLQQEILKFLNANDPEDEGLTSVPIYTVYKES